MRAATPQEHADHRRDLQKNGDLDPSPVDAHTVAMLARAKSTTFDEAVEFIQSYANMVAAQAVINSIHEMHKQTMQVLEGSNAS